MDSHGKLSTGFVKNGSENDFDLVSLPASDVHHYSLLMSDDNNEYNLMNEQIKDGDKLFAPRLPKPLFADGDWIGGTYEVNGNKDGQKVSIVQKDKSNADGDSKAPSLLLAQQLENQSLLDNKYVELEKKVNMEKERYEKEIEQLNDRKNELEQTLMSYEKKRYLKEIEQLKNEKKKLEQTVADMGRDRDALIEKMEMVCQERVQVNESSKMPKAMEMDAIICAIRAMKNSETENRSEQICLEFNKKYGRDWHCFVFTEPYDEGYNYDWYIQEEGDNYIDFSIDGYRICLFKTVPSTGEV